MKGLKYILVLLIVGAATANAQEKVEYEKDGDQVKQITYFEDSEKIKEIGHFMNGVSHGRWVQYDQNGTVTTEAYYQDGKKVGTWFVWANDGATLYELAYEDNKLVQSHKWAIEERNFLADR